MIQKLLRFYPFYKGRGRFVYGTKIKAHLQALSKPTIVRLHDGSCAYVDPTDYIGSMLYLYGDLDPSISWCIKSILRPGDVFVDIGANVGVEAIPASRLVGSEGEVFAFEPSEPVRDLLADSCVLNNLRNICILTDAVSNIDGMINFQPCTDNTGNARVVSLDDLSAGESVACTKFDSIKALRGKHIKLLKIDVEGHEKEVLEGAIETLKSGRVDSIIVEIWHSNLDSTALLKLPAVSILVGLGYSIFQISRRLSLFPCLLRVNQYTRLASSADFLFIRTENLHLFGLG